MKKFFGLIIVLIISILLVGCSPRYNVKSYTYYSHFNTTSTVQIKYNVNQISTNKINSCFKGVDSILLKLDKIFNIQDTTRTQKTELMKVNEASGINPVVVSSEVIEVLKKAIEISELSKDDDKKLYDPTIGVIWKEWDFVNKGYSPISPAYYNPVTNERISALLPLVNIDNVVIDEDASTVFLKEKGMVLDLGSVVKGYACDKIKSYLVEEGIRKAVINVGGNILLLGDAQTYGSEVTKWEVQIRTPYYQTLASDFGFLGSLSLDESTVVTSGTYEKYIMDENKNMYHHILDPRTGYPVNNGITSVTVITDNSLEADALSTTLLIMGLEKGLEYVNSISGVEAVFVQKTENGSKVYISNGLENKNIFHFNKELEKINYSYEGVL